MKFNLLYIVVLCTAIEVSSASSRSSFGEECSRTRKCDRKAWLSCYDGLCDCTKPEEMHYDNDKGKCVTKSGERCKFGVEESGETGLVEITDCVPNSQCGDDGICVCDSKYHEIFNGTCEISKSFGESCSDEDKCSKFENLHCINGICGCKEGISVYSVAETQCVGVLHQNCIEEECFEGAECKDGKCVCDVDHYEDSSTNTCVLRKRVNEKCSSDSECVHKGLFMLKCLNGACNCEEGFQLSTVQRSPQVVHRNYYRQYEDAYEQMLSYSMTGTYLELCAPLVGRECPDGYCVPNSKCVISQDRLSTLYSLYVEKFHSLVSSQSEDGTAIKPSFPPEILYNDATCQCLPEYPYPNKDKTKCGRRYGSPNQYYGNNDMCYSNDDCLNNLVCYKQSCNCQSKIHQKVSDDREYCVTKIGGPCKTDSTCIVNSFCKLLLNSTVGHCQCKEGYVDNSDRECEASHGIPCEYSNDKCDKAADLICVNRKCACADDVMYKYSQGARKCLGLVGALCNKAISCVENAKCLEVNSALPGTCICKDGYKETENFTCEAIVKVEL